MERKARIQELLNRLDVLQGKKTLTEAVTFLLDEEASVPRETLKDSPAGKAIAQIASHVGKIRSDPRLNEMSNAIEKAREESGISMEAFANEFSRQIESLMTEVRNVEERGSQLTTIEVTNIIERLGGYEQDFSEGINRLVNKNSLLEAEVSRISQALPGIYGLIEGVEQSTPTIEVHTTDLDEVRQRQSSQEEEITKLKEDLFRRISLIQQVGGGNQNRDIRIGGNSSTLSKYTDINLKAGAGTTISYANNDTTKFLDVTITATGSGSGSTRSVNNISTSQTAGEVASTDYVYIVSAGAKLTLPDATTNTNLYTVKNTSSSSVMVDTTSAQTIDGSTNLILPIQYTSVDIISNGTNWDIT